MFAQAGCVLLETAWAFKCAGESHWTYCPHCGDPFDDVLDACTHHLLLCRVFLRGVDNERANLVDIASVQGLTLLSVHPGSMEAVIPCDHC